MIDERAAAPCPICRSRFDGLCAALDGTRAELAELRAEKYRRVDGPPIAEPSTSVGELRLELADAQRQIGELERANRHWRDVASAERRRAEHAEDAQRRSLRVGFDVVRRA